jgi:hypothetical protein
MLKIFRGARKVPVLSIIACRILEDELTRVLSLDRKLRHLILVDNTDGDGLSGKLRAEGRPHLVISRKEIPDLIENLQNGNSNGFLKPLLNRFRFKVSKNHRAQDLIVIVNVLKMALHSDSKVLREEVYRNISDMSGLSDGILLFYGLCGNSLANIGNDLGDLGCPIYFLTDAGEKRVDDCISVALGGNKQYEETLRKFPAVGIYFTPMWAFNLKEMDKEVGKSSKSLSLGSTLNNLGYKKVAKLDTGLHYIRDFEVDSRIGDFADSYNLEVVSLRASSDIAEKCYKKARDSVVKE